MQKVLVAGLAALALLAPAQASAVVFLGARLGYALPSGDVQKGTPVKDFVSANVPVQVDAGMSVLGIASLGLYASLGPTRMQSDVVDTTGQNLRAGLQFNLRPPVVLNSLWGGVFAGLEQQRLKSGSATSKYTGWEAGLQAGYDFSVLPFIKMGPYASYSLAQFVSASGAELGTKAQHTALTFGLRGLFDF